VPLYYATGGAAAAGASGGGDGRQPCWRKHAWEEGCSSVVRRASPGQVPVALRRHRGVACRGRCAEQRHARARHRTASRAFRALSCLRDSRCSMEGDGRCRQSPNTGTLRRARGGSSESDGRILPPKANCTTESSSVFHPGCMLHSIATRWGDHRPSGHRHLLCALRIAGWPGGVASGSRRVREVFPVQGVWEA
jgi:hypothetical protein